LDWDMDAERKRKLLWENAVNPKQVWHRT